MSDVMEIRATETGVVRVFHIDLPHKAIDRFTQRAGTGEWPLQYTIGALYLRDAFVDVVPIRDLGAMRLSQYLIDAHGVDETEIKPDAPRLDAVAGYIAILPSQAFDAHDQTLVVRSPMQWIGSYRESPTRSISPPLRSKSARGTLSGPAAAQRPSASMSRGLLALAALIILVIALSLGLAR
ncbi:MAG: aspartate carbamoyltransferase catalytic subunit [Paracoccaceae bacterium]